jgi:hypothetical protein
LERTTKAQAQQTIRVPCAARQAKLPPLGCFVAYMARLALGISHRQAAKRLWLDIEKVAGEFFRATSVS